MRRGGHLPLRPAYEAYRLNRGGIGEDTVLVPADAWRRVLRPGGASSNVPGVRW